MGVSHFPSSLCCDLRILQAKNIEPKSPGNLFVRYYLSAGNNKRIKLNSHEISSKSELIWNESFSLECSGAEESLNDLKQQTVVFELRWRSTMRVLGKMGKSQLLGRAEMPWKAVFESPNMEIEKYWLIMVSMNDRVLESLKPPSLQISMKLIRGPAIVEIEKKNKRKERLKNNCDGCGCKDIGGGYSCADYEIFALAAAMEAL
ncbi:hypothetical protein CRYUN_Cryun17cG0092400 [Craigia yunnanensis]